MIARLALELPCQLLIFHIRMSLLVLSWNIFYQFKIKSCLDYRQILEWLVDGKQMSLIDKFKAKEDIFEWKLEALTNHLTSHNKSYKFAEDLKFYEKKWNFNTSHTFNGVPFNVLSGDPS